MNVNQNAGKLINPSVARFMKEGRRLYIGVPVIYAQFAKTVFGIGIGMIVIGIVSTFGGPIANYGAWWWWFFGLLVALAAGWAIYLFDFVDCDLKERVYKRRFGAWPQRRTLSGSLNEMDAVVLTYEKIHMAGMGPEAFYLRIHWKDQSIPPTLLKEVMIEGNATFQAHEIIQGYAPFAYIQGLELGHQFAQALQTRFFNSTGLPLPPRANPAGPQGHSPNYPGARSPY